MNKDYLKWFKGFSFFFKAVRASLKDIAVSLVVLVVFTVVLDIILFFVEHAAQPEVFRTFWDATVWSHMDYLGNPGHFSPGYPITGWGRALAIVSAILKIAIVAVPAGMVANGFRKAMDDEKREQKLKELRERVGKSFRRNASSTLREYLNNQPDKGGERLKVMNFVPQYVPVSRLQVRQGMDLKDITDVCQKFPEFRLKNLAQIHGEEEALDTVDRFVVETLPLNRKYGCCIDRGSHVTILCTSSWDEVGMGHFCYYLAMLGGFNYIGKEVEAYPDETDSFYNYSEQPLYNKLTKDKLLHDKGGQKVLRKKEAFRQEFEKDLNALCSDDGRWVVIVTEHIKNSANNVDFHLAHTLRDGSESTVSNRDAYQRLCAQLTEAMKELNLSVQQPSERYPLMKKNIGYHIRKNYNANTNCFVLRPSSELVNSALEMPVAYRLAVLLSEVLDGGRGIQDDDMGLKDLKAVGFGYKQKEYAKTK